MNKPSDIPATAPIGVFDSGLGGLRVLDGLKNALPHERFVYLGDTLHMPYGLKTPEQLHHYVNTALHWLIAEQGVKLMVVACNTASAVASDLFEQYPAIPFVDPVTPICRWLADNPDQYQRIGVMATPATVASNRYAQLLPDAIALRQMPCGGLATVIEEGRGDSEECRALLREFVLPLTDWDMQGLILGCTHYPYVSDTIAQMLPEGVEILNPAIYMVTEVQRLLAENQIAAPSEQAGHIDFYVTDAPKRFFQTSKAMPFRFLEMDFPRQIALFPEEQVVNQGTPSSKP